MGQRGAPMVIRAPTTQLWQTAWHSNAKRATLLQFHQLVTAYFTKLNQPWRRTRQRRNYALNATRRINTLWYPTISLYEHRTVTFTDLLLFNRKLIVINQLLCWTNKIIVPRKPKWQRRKIRRQNRRRRRQTKHLL